MPKSKEPLNPQLAIIANKITLHRNINGRMHSTAWELWPPIFILSTHHIIRIHSVSRRMNKCRNFRVYEQKLMPSVAHVFDLSKGSLRYAISPTPSLTCNDCSIHIPCWKIANWKCFQYDSINGWCNDIKLILFTLFPCFPFILSALFLESQYRTLCRHSRKIFVVYFLLFILSWHCGAFTLFVEHNFRNESKQFKRVSSVLGIRKENWFLCDCFYDLSSAHCRIFSKLIKILRVNESTLKLLFHQPNWYMCVWCEWLFH